MSIATASLASSMYLRAAQKGARIDACNSNMVGLEDSCSTIGSMVGLGRKYLQQLDCVPAMT